MFKFIGGAVVGALLTVLLVEGIRYLQTGTFATEFGGGLFLTVLLLGEVISYIARKTEFVKNRR